MCHDHHHPTEWKYTKMWLSICLISHYDCLHVLYTIYTAVKTQFFRYALWVHWLGVRCMAFSFSWAPAIYVCHCIHAEWCNHLLKVFQALDCRNWDMGVILISSIRSQEDHFHAKVIEKGFKVSEYFLEKYISANFSILITERQNIIIDKQTNKWWWIYVQ